MNIKRENFTYEDFKTLIINCAKDDTLDPNTPEKVKMWIDKPENELCYYAEFNCIHRIKFDFNMTDTNLALALAIIALRHNYRSVAAADFIEEYDEYIKSLEEVTPYNMTPGRVFYRVTVVPGSNQVYMNEQTILDYPSKTYSGRPCDSLFVKVRVKFERREFGTDSYETEDSLQDMNIVPNNYNKHRAFYNKEAAIAYMDKFK
jgi:hypothetical protein